MLETLLRTKLYIPPQRPNLVPRHQLINRLDDGLQLGHKLTLISAPAGFGKTTLASEWIASCGWAAAWLSLDDGDNDPIRFLNYLIAALQTVMPDVGEGALALLQLPQPLSPESILTALLNEITAVSTNTILILDDYHLIDAQSVDHALIFLLEHLPQQMHLVIATREDPNLPLARLRVRGQLSELRAAELRFTPAEASAFLNQAMGLNLSEEDIHALEVRTEGWIAGLQLAALSMRGREDNAEFIKAFSGDHRYVVDYLVEEVLQRQAEHIRSFLLQTSILDRLSGPLCDAVTGLEDGKGLLEDLERGNLFVIPLDDKRQWYRYHHLFAEVLHVHLVEEQPDQVSTLHQRASAWYEHNGFPADAVHHALAAKDFERAASLAELTWPEWSGSFQSITWLSWLKMLPDEIVRARPVLCVAYAWAYLNAGELEAAGVWLLNAERCLEAPSSAMVVVDEEQFRTLPVSLATARAYHAQAVGDVDGTMKYARQVLEHFPTENLKWRGDATALLGLAYWTNGDLEEAHQTLSDGLADMNPLDVIVGTFVLADMKATLGYLDEALWTCEHALRLASEQGKPMPLGTEDVYTEISKLHRERGELEAAVQDLAAGKKLGEQIELPDWRHRWCIAQARLQETLGDLDGALVLLDEAQQHYVRTPLPDVRPIAASKARIWARQGRKAEALGWARQQGLSTGDELSYLREFEYITLARVLIAQYKAERIDGSIDETVGLLKRLLKAAEEGNRTGSVIEILVLLALAHEAQNDIPMAITSLERALMLAEPQGYVRVFVDEGVPMARLLSAAAVRGVVPDYLGKLKAAFEAEGQLSEANPYLPPASLDQSLVEPLSQRELEVLQLIAQGLSNREIGERLYLALDTVKGHNRRIFGKLGVNKRMQAVSKAISLKIIPPQ